ncbi:MAG TPA: maltose alpha-D-glucosyltransferase [Gammaproteobacteria bacterium]|nr:maltose alpha-D-glucosyltransferase [Gammaproteobacteria bacterium]
MGSEPIFSPADAIDFADDPLWYKDAVIYEVHVKSFFDHNDDGLGDFPGLTAKLDYIQRLGVNTIWLLPFYPSPMRDDGYDIADYRNINPVYGTLRDFRTFVREAHGRGLKIITELVINHTSDQHPWFKAARAAPRGSAKRDFYVWSDTDDKFSETRIIFTDTEASNWTWDPVAKQYYWHRFFSHQPDLNHNNPQVVKAVIRVMKFWLDLGVDGFRLDAIPYLCVREGTDNENLPETHAVIKQIRAAVDRGYANRMLLAEANQWPEDVAEYFGGGDECHMAYHFPLMPRMYMAIAQEDRYPIVEILQQTPEIPETCQWAIFLRNHDELTLEMVTDRERDYMYSTYATDPRMRVNVGIRRRLAPLMDNDRAKIELMNSLLFSMPGSPIVYYGDELGMGDNIFLGDRNGVRTPMQWSPDRNAGFSRADPQRLFLPPIMDPVYGYEAVNVEAQSRESASLLNWTRRILAVRSAHKAFGRGTLELLRPGNRKIIAYIRRYGDEVLLCVANLKRYPQAVELDLSPYRGLVPVELMGRSAFPPIGELPYLLTLAGHGFYWFELTSAAKAPSWHEEFLSAEPPPWLVLFDSLASFTARGTAERRSLADRLVQQFEGEVLPAYLRQQRWFAAKDDTIVSTSLSERCEWKSARGDWLLTMARVELASGAKQRYFLPLAVDWHAERIGPAAASALARVRQRSQTGLLFDAFAEETFCRDLVDRIRNELPISCAFGRIEFRRTAALEGLLGADLDALSVRRPSTEGTNSAFLLGDSLFLKAYRRVRDGINPEWEMGRFLTDVSPCRATVPTAGTAEYVAPDGERATLALLQASVKNQGDAWSFTLRYLERTLEVALTRSEPMPAVEVSHMEYLVLMRTLAARTAELHRALAVTTGDPAFDPEPFGEARVAEWRDRLHAEIDETLRLLAKHRDGPSGAGGDFETEAAPERMERIGSALHERVDSLCGRPVRALATRFHGDYHLGQVLICGADFIIVDLEGEPGRPFDERRRKTTALKDVAGMLRSFDYAKRAAARALAAEALTDATEVDALLRRWRDETRAGFLAAYRDAMQGCPAYPEDPDDAERLIELAEIEKLLYELRYELKNRPDWLSLPWRDLTERLGERAS